MAFVESPKYDIRYTEEADRPYLKRLLMKPENLHWLLQTKESEVDLLIQNWIGFARFKAALTCVYESVPIAFGAFFLFPYRKVAHMAMLQFVVDPEYKRRGVGESLLKNLVHLGRERFHLESLHLDLPEISPAVKLLEKLDFVPVVTQADYFCIDGKYSARKVMERIL